ncbi:peptide synthetase [Salinisphaera sp. S4-8]|uniref:serine aminopeptidase domain-containing protein n=1 Tax=Salinisphaera sp. S4-8 TaxID=633357 RepID=UPI003340D7D6
MVPFFFGAQDALYGAYHPPAPDSRAPETALLICQGIGYEYMRSYRACWQIAQAAAARNAHVLRFDYRGTGDSHGRQHDASWQEWIANTGTAIAWLRETTALSHIRILGVRVGALIAAAASARDSERRRLVFWDPVVDGQAYLRAIADMHESQTRNMNRYRPRRHHHAERGADEYLGFHWPDAVVDGLARANLMDYAAERVDDWQLALSQGERVRPLEQSVTERNGQVLEMAENMDWFDIRAQYRRVALARSTDAMLDRVLG